MELEKIKKDKNATPHLTVPIAGTAETDFPHYRELLSLPRHHGDPFDRLIIAQAALEGMVLGTQDPLMRPYGVAILGLH